MALNQRRTDGPGLTLWHESQITHVSHHTIHQYRAAFARGGGDCSVTPQQYLWLRTAVNLQGWAGYWQGLPGHRQPWPTAVD